MNVTNDTTPNVTQAPINWTSLSEEMCDKLKGVKIGDVCDTVNQQTFAATIFRVFINLEIFAAINFRAFVSVAKSAKT